MRSTFSDNILVSRQRHKHGKDVWYSNDFFAVAFYEVPSADKGELKYEMGQVYYEPCRNRVAVRRYCVPGRCDYYSFALTCMPSGYGDSIDYGSEGFPDDSIEQGLKMLRKDLDRPQVLEMLKRICAKADKPGEHRGNCICLCEFLLKVVAPKSKAIKVMRKALNLNLKTGQFVGKVSA